MAYSTTTPFNAVSVSCHCGLTPAFPAHNARAQSWLANIGRCIGPERQQPLLHSIPVETWNLPENNKNARKYIGAAVTTVFTSGPKLSGRQSVVCIPMVARVSIVDYAGNVVLDTYVRPTRRITDYRTETTGIQWAHLATAPPFAEVQRIVFRFLQGKVLIGHSLWVLLSVMGLSHSALDTRDLALFRPLRKKLKSRKIVGLPALTHIVAGRNMDLQNENSLEFARNSMEIYRRVEMQFEEAVSKGAWPCNLPPSGFVDYYV